MKKNKLVLGLLLGAFFVSLGYATAVITNHVGTIPVKSTGDRLSYGELNKIVGTLKGIYNTTLDNRIGIGTEIPSTGEETLKLDIEGPVGATNYCDEDGNNCFAVNETIKSLFELSCEDGETIVYKVVNGWECTDIAEVALEQSNTASEQSNTVYFDGSTDYFTKNFSEGTGQKWALSVWVKKEPGGLIIFGAGSGGRAQEYAMSIRNEYISLGSDSNLLNIWERSVDSIDIGEWHHLWVGVDTSTMDGEDRIQMAINGTRVDTSSDRGLIRQGVGFKKINNNVLHGLGALENGTDKYKGLLAEVYFIDGLTPGPEAFTQVSGGQLIPKRYSGNFGQNGFYLDFKDPNALGKDASGNENNWVPQSIDMSNARSESGIYASLFMVCGDGTCDGALGETADNCPEDC